MRHLLLALHVVGFFAADRAEPRGELEEPRRLVRVDVKPHLAARARDHEARAKRGGFFAELAAIDDLSGNRALGAVAVLEVHLRAGRGLVIGEELDRGVVAGLDAGLEVIGHAGDEFDEAERSGVDDIGAPEHLELFGRGLERYPGGSERLAEEWAEFPRALRGRRHGGAREVRDYREDRALARLDERLARVGGTAHERVCELARRQCRRLRRAVADAEQELREDGARVAARAVERGIRDTRQQFSGVRFRTRCEARRAPPGASGRGWCRCRRPARERR